MIYLLVSYETSIKGAYTNRWFVSISDRFIPFQIDPTETVGDIWERLSLMIENDDLDTRPFGEKFVDRLNDALTIEQLLLNGLAGGRYLSEIWSMVIDIRGEAQEFVRYRVADMVVKRNPTL